MIRNIEKSYIGVIIFGGIEIATILATFITLIYIERFPMILLFLPTPIAILGIFTIKLKPLARRLNLILSPIIVLTYTCLFMILLECILSFFRSPLKLKELYFYCFFISMLIAHIYFFTREKVKILFQ